MHLETIVSLLLLAYAACALQLHYEEPRDGFRSSVFPRRPFQRRLESRNLPDEHTSKAKDALQVKNAYPKHHLDERDMLEIIAHWTHAKRNPDYVKVFHRWKTCNVILYQCLKPTPLYEYKPLLVAEVTIESPSAGAEIEAKMAEEIKKLAGKPTIKLLDAIIVEHLETTYYIITEYDEVAAKSLLDMAFFKPFLCH